MKAPLLFSFGLIFSFFASHPTSGATAYQYRYDDGSSEVTFSTIPPSFIGTLSEFRIVPGAEVITGVEVAFKTVPNGLPVSVYLWSDPNGDGNPSDARVLANVNGISANAGTDVFTSFALSPTTLPIGDSFFVGVIAFAPAGTALTAIDSNSTAGKSWRMQWLQSTPDPNNLALGTNVGQQNVGAGIDPPGDWMIRADAVAVPEPVTSPLVTGTVILLVMVFGPRFSKRSRRG